MENKQTILGVRFDNVDLSQAYDIFIKFVDGPSLKTIFTPNPEFLLNAKKDTRFKNILNSGDLVLPDGIGIIISSRILKRPIMNRVSGVDLILMIFERSNIFPLSIFILGSSEKNCQTAAENIKNSYSNVNVLGYQHGYYKSSDETDIVKRINDLSPDLLLVALGSPRQEKFIYEHKSSLTNVKCAIGVGGTVDVLSGNTKLTPGIVRKAGFEWLYRTITEPKRIKRVIRLPLVVIYALIERIKGY